MFTSISNAVPYSTATTSFTAIESCLVDFGVSLTVRVNSASVSSFPVSLSTGDVIAVDCSVPAANQVTYIPWTYNGNQCYFAVVANPGNLKPTVNSSYVNLPWWQYSTASTIDAGFDLTSTTQAALPTSGTTGAFSVDQVAFLDQKDGNIITYKAGNTYNRIYSDTVSAIGHTKIRNTATGLWDHYFLRSNGRIDVVSGSTGSLTTGSTLFTSAKCIWSDGSSVFLGGVSYLVSLLDASTVGQTWSTSESILNGVACGPSVFVSTASGKLYYLQGTSLVLLEQAGSYGEMATFANKILVPIPSLCKVRVYNSANRAIFRDINTGNRAPFAVSSGRSGFAVTFYKSHDVLFYSTYTSPGVVLTADRNITYASPISSTEMICSTLLSTFDTTTLPNPTVSGVTLPYWTSPPNTDTGAGDSTATFGGTSTSVSASPNATLLVQGQTGQTTIATGQTVSLFTRSATGRKSAALRIGSYGFDFFINGVNQTTKSLLVDIPVQAMANTVTTSFTVPAGVSGAALSASHGTLSINGSPHTGSTLVNAGDTVQLVVKPYSGATQYWGMVNLADSQFAVVINNSTTSVYDTQIGQNQYSLTTSSTIAVSETGTYYFPNFSTGSVSKNGSVLSFPASLTAGDSVTIIHEKMSGLTQDARHTFLMGPTKNYEVIGITGTDDIPDNKFFGTILNGVPGVETTGPITVTMSGYSDNYSTTISSPNFQFSINGGALSPTPTVKNGDTVTAYYTIQNLYETMQIYSTRVDGSLYPFGTLSMAGPDAEWFPVTSSYGINGLWKFIPSDEPIENQTIRLATKSSTIVKSSLAALGKSDTVNSTPLSQKMLSGWAPFSHMEPTAAPTGNWAPFSHVESTPSSTAIWYSYLNIESAPTGDGYWYPYSHTETVPSSVSAKPPVASIMSFTRRSGIYNATSFAGRNTNWIKFIKASYASQDVIGRIQYQSNWSQYRVATYWNKSSGNSYTGYRPPFIKGEREWFRTFSPTWYQLPADGHDPLYPVIKVFATFNHANISNIPMIFVNKNFDPVNPVEMHFEYVSEYDSADFEFGAEILEQATFLSSPLIGNAEPIASVATPAAPSGFYAVEPHWDYSIPDKVGGFDTAEEAQAWASSYYMDFASTIYQQPEGTFSYIIARDTGLVCKVEDSGLRAANWLIGGG